jgi:hypothetical protein
MLLVFLVIIVLLGSAATFFISKFSLVAKTDAGCCSCGQVLPIERCLVLDDEVDRKKPHADTGSGSWSGVEARPWSGWGQCPNWSSKPCILRSTMRLSRRAREYARESVGRTTAMTTGADDERLQEIERWFRDRDILLGFDNAGGNEWHAVMLPANTRIGSADYAVGATKVEAAEAAKAKYNERSEPLLQSSHDVALRIVGEEPPGSVKTAQVEDVALTLTDSVEVQKYGSDSGTGAESAEVTKKLERVLTDYGWRIGFNEEPDGNVTGYLMDEKNGEVLKTARGDDFQDAYLGLGIDTTPPSEEVRRENR